MQLISQQFFVMLLRDLFFRAGQLSDSILFVCLEDVTE